MLKRLLPLLVALLIPCVHSAQQGTHFRKNDTKELARSNITISMIPDSLLNVVRPPDRVFLPGLGVVPKDEVPQGWEYDPGGFYRRYATLQPSETYEDLHYYYSDYVARLDPEEKRQELENIRKAARQYKSGRLEDEAWLLDAYMTAKEISPENIARGLDVARRFLKEGKPEYAVRLKANLFARCREGDKPNYYTAFHIADELIRDLEELTETQFPWKRTVYVAILACQSFTNINDCSY